MKSGSEGCDGLLEAPFSREDDPAFERVINFPPVESVLRLWRKSAVSLKMSNYLYGLLFLSCLNSAKFLQSTCGFEQFSTQITSFKRYAVLKI